MCKSHYVLPHAIALGIRYSPRKGVFEDTTTAGSLSCGCRSDVSDTGALREKWAEMECILALKFITQISSSQQGAQFLTEGFQSLLKT